MTILQECMRRLMDPKDDYDTTDVDIGRDEHQDEQE